MDAVKALKQLGGIARAADIVALSSRRRLRTAVANKVVIHVDRDRYALPVTDLGRRLAVEHNLHLTHLSAALHHGWEVRTSPGVPQLLLLSGQERPTSKARFWTYDARREDLDEVHRDGVVPASCGSLMRTKAATTRAERATTRRHPACRAAVRQPLWPPHRYRAAH